MRLAVRTIAALSGAAFAFTAWAAEPATDAVVLGAVLESLCAARVTVAVQIETAGVPAMAPARTGADLEAAIDLRRRAAVPGRLPAAPTCARVRRVPRAHVDAVMKKSRRMDYVGDLGRDVALLYTLSLPGYAPDRSFALVQVGVRCGVLCGGQFVYRLERTGTAWRIVRRVQTAVS